MAQNEFSETSGVEDLPKIRVDGWTQEVVEFALRTTIERMVKRLLEQGTYAGYVARDSAWLERTKSKKQKRRLKRRIIGWARGNPVVAIYNSVPFQRSGAVFAPCRFVDGHAFRSIAQDTGLRSPPQNMIHEALTKILGEPKSPESTKSTLTPDNPLFSFSSDTKFFNDRFILSRIEYVDPEYLITMEKIRWSKMRDRDENENLIMWHDRYGRRTWPRPERWHIAPDIVDPETPLWLLTIPEARPFSLPSLIEAFRKKIEEITR